MKYAIVAMSGGVDSSVTAYLMREAGYEVVGATMKLFDSESSTNNYADALAVASRLGFECKLYDMSGQFRCDVMESFVREYEQGNTPNPCIECNRNLKFEALYNLAREDISATADEIVLVTGHYARIEHDEESDRFLLRKAFDPAKDQSYVLYNMTQEQLRRTVFPLGSMSKSEARDIAEENALITARKKDSQDICFIPNGDYPGFIRSFTGRDYPPGEFVTTDGTVIGEHRGIINYTIGQRKGLGLALKKPAYVQRLDIENNQVVLGDNEGLYRAELLADNWNWLSIPEPSLVFQDSFPSFLRISLQHEKTDGSSNASLSFRALARIRYKHQEAPATIFPLPSGAVRILFDEPQRAITAGQSVVLYGGPANEYVLGGGVIR